MRGERLRRIGGLRAIFHALPSDASTLTVSTFTTSGLWFSSPPARETLAGNRDARTSGQRLLNGLRALPARGPEPPPTACNEMPSAAASAFSNWSSLARSSNNTSSLPGSGKIPDCHSSSANAWQRSPSRQGLARSSAADSGRYSAAASLASRAISAKPLLSYVGLIRQPAIRCRSPKHRCHRRSVSS